MDTSSRRFIRNCWILMALSLAAVGCEETTSKPGIPGITGLTGGTSTGETSGGTTGPTTSTGGTTGATGDVGGGGSEAGGDGGPGDGSTGGSGGSFGTGGGGDATAITTEVPDRAVGDWKYYEVEGALCRDGSPAGYFRRPGTDPDHNLMVFMNGGGVCFDDFLCAFNPKNVDESMPGQTVQDATVELVTNLQVVKVPQTPFDDGIFKRDPRNPVAEWDMVFVPYCTGDVFAGTRPDGDVPGSSLQGTQQLVGYGNIGLFLDSFGYDYQDAGKVLLAGGSAGSVATLLNFDRVQTFFGDVPVVVLADSGIPFGDEWNAPCMQQKWRDLFGLDAMLPEDCDGCFNADGGGLVDGLGRYIFKEKYPGRVLGGGVSSKGDQIMRLFYATGLDDCSYDSSIAGVSGFFGLPPYPQEDFEAGLGDFIDNVAGRDRVGSYIMEGDLHMHTFRPRFYEDNGTGMTMADWLADILAGKATHVGDL